MENAANNNLDEQLDNEFGKTRSSEEQGTEFENEELNGELKEDDVIIDTETGAAEDTDKYLAMEQPGVQYTHETDPTMNSDHLDFNEQSNEDEWNSEGGNSKNSDAFNQDDYILNDNVDLDEDQNKSISTDDEDFEESNERYTN
ncbi:MAG: hypothetical protein EOO45_10690 [Flavobacterium sp.]|nr:MAG: hypothetical protein EOO45_10690 [Flavobacterium sp.]